jgi:hypothetical protein
VQQQKSWWDWTDEELAAEAQASMRGQGALVESMRRLRASTEIHSWWLARSSCRTDHSLSWAHFRIGVGGGS